MNDATEKKEKRRKRIANAAVGAFAIAGIVAIVGAFVLLSGKGRDGDAYGTRFSNVSGIAKGTKVAFEGFIVGRVDDVLPARTDDKVGFLVKLSIDRDWIVPEGSTTKVTASGILSAMIIDIKAGPGPGRIPVGGEIPGKATSDNLYSAATDVSGKVGELSATLKDISDNDLRRTIGALDAQIKRLEPLLDKDVPALIGHLNRMGEDGERMTKILSERIVTEKNAELVQKTLVAALTLAAGAEETRRRIDKTAERADALLAGGEADVRETVRELRKTLRSVSESADPLLRDMEASARNLREFSGQLRNDPSILIRGRDAGE
jgi:phospholipid/cholesterol/gamma-HCH transport system substrate-binding protein